MKENKKEKRMKKMWIRRQLERKREEWKRTSNNKEYNESGAKWPVISHTSGR